MNMYLKKILLIAIVATACSKKPEQATETKATLQKPLQPSMVVALGRIEPEGKLVSLACEVGGIVRSVPIKEGEQVKKGAVLIELNHDLQSAKLMQVKSNYATQQSQINSDKAALTKAEIQLKNSERTFNRIKSLASSQAETTQSLDDAENLFRQQEQEVQRLKQVVTTSENKLQEVRAQIAQAEAEVNQRIVTAPNDGLVLKLDVVPGDAVATGTTIGEFAPAGPITAFCEVDELFSSMIELNLNTYVRLQGKTDTLAVGQVTFVGPYLKKKSLFSETAGDAEDRRVREVRITLKNASQILFNTRVECVISLPKTK
jgi:multidrug efflux pump subunit AcrA (membrane-fusion protein)